MKNILIVDDSDFMRDRLREILEEMDKTIIGEARNGREAVEVFKQTKPDLVLLDINMPELSGKDALVQIINHDPKAKVIICSSFGSEETVAECIEEGAMYYLLKPFIKANVVKIIGNFERILG